MDAAERVGAFVDACITDPAEARRLAAADPELLQAQWAGDPLLHWMVIEDFVGGATVLLDLGVPVDGRDSCGRTALHYASCQGRLGCARLLLSRGADANAVNDHFFENPLHCAVQSQAGDVVLLLLGHGARADYLLSTHETVFSAMQDWPSSSREQLVARLTRDGITRDSMFAKMGNLGYESPEQAFGW